MAEPTRPGRAIEQDQATAPLVAIRDLRIGFVRDKKIVETVRGVDLDLYRGERVALVGESGSGKSVTARAVVGLLRPEARVLGGTVEVDGHDVLRMSSRQLRAHRGRVASMVFQDPMSSLDPVMRIGDQVSGAVQAHGRRPDARARAVELMKLVGIPDPDKRLADYPHHYSGGMRQRVMIALALAGDPDVLVADEPTTALDVTIQAQILQVFDTVNTTLGTTILLITHNMGLVARLCDRVAVMYAGRIVESGDTRTVFSNPQHEYTAGLLGSLVRLTTDRSVPLPSIGGLPPDFRELPAGCAFAPRCDLATAVCLAEYPPMENRGEGSHSACWHADAVRAPVVDESSAAPVGPVVTDLPDPSASLTGAPVVDVVNATVSYRVGRGRKARQLTAVDGVDLQLRAGETMGLVGESGCGKSSLAKLLMLINPVTDGQVDILGQNIAELGGADLRAMRREIQMVFQDPYGSLNPRHTVERILTEPLVVARRLPGGEISKEITSLLERVGLDDTFRDRLPAQLSGGQRQRVGIARALAVQPQILLLDEPVSALDVSMQAQIVNLLREITAGSSTAALFIAHDIAVVRHMSDRISVMYLGRIVEHGDAERVCAAPAHPYTEALIDAVPEPDPAQRDLPRTTLRGDTPSPLDPPSGCPFHTRCPHGPLVHPDRTRCTTDTPTLRTVGAGRQVACHYPLGSNSSAVDELQTLSIHFRER
ncbi:MAG: dipeptide ABC transporter ATP-binding protein [Marmoricola sp.]